MFWRGKRLREDKTTCLKDGAGSKSVVSVFKVNVSPIAYADLQVVPLGSYLLHFGSSHIAHNWKPAVTSGFLQLFPHSTANCISFPELPKDCKVKSELPLSNSSHELYLLPTFAFLPQHWPTIPQSNSNAFSSLPKTKTNKQKSFVKHLLYVRNLWALL